MPTYVEMIFAHFSKKHFLTFKPEKISMFALPYSEKW
jgi:hypothetical protein